MGNRYSRQKLQIIFYCVIIFFLFVGLSTRSEATGDEPLAELSKMTEVMGKQGIEMTNWTIYTREHLNNWESLDATKDELALIQNKTTDFKWELEPANDQRGQKKTVATKDHLELGITETLTYIAYPHNDKFHSYLIYEVQGNNYSKDMNQVLSPIIVPRLEDLFLTNSTIFTCTKGTVSDKLNLDLEQQSDEILAQFSAQKIEFLKEETFISVSAYTNIWNNSIISSNEKMNLQVAIRANQDLGGQTTITIGTPIIMSEY
jgi:hypothetical protein